MRSRAGTWILGAAALLAASEGRGEDGAGQGWDGRVFITLAGGYGLGSGGFSYRDSQVVFLEEASAEARVTGHGGPAVDVGCGVRLAGRFGVGVTLSRIRQTQPATVSLSVPHPLLYNHPASATATESIDHKEVALHYQAIYRVPMGKKLRLGAFAGPTHFDLHQPLVKDVGLDPSLSGLTYSLGTPTILTTDKTTSAWGFNAGVDVTVRFSRFFGIGALARYSRASVHLENALKTTRTGVVDKTVSVHMGGLQVEGGLRLQF